ncbi:MAG: Calx-beta domain-containing protein [Planctomycetota bacterium]
MLNTSWTAPVRLLTITLALFSALFLAGCNDIFDDDRNEPSIPVAPSGLSYPSPVEVYQGLAMTTLVPTVSGGIDTWSIAPALPDGINFNTANGRISGTPTTVTPSASYTITAENTLGSDSFNLILAVIPVPVPDVNFETTSSTVEENGVGSELVVTLSETTLVDVVIPFSVGGTATEGDDFTITASPITIPAGSSSALISVNMSDDATAEGLETVVVTLDPPTNGSLGADVEHVVTIVDDEGVPTVVFTAPTSSASEAAGTVTIGISLVPAASNEVVVTVQLGTMGATATDGEDFDVPSATVTIPAGSISGNLAVTLIDDTEFEGDETIVVEIAGATGADIGNETTHTHTIIDDDPAPTAGISPTAANLMETDAPLTLTVGLNTVSSVDTVIPFTTGGSATVIDDFTLSPASPLTIPAGSLTASIVLTPVDDGADEGNETVTITLQSSPTVTIGTGTATITLEDPPSPPVGLTYSDDDAFLPIGQPMTPLTPSLAAGSADSFSVNPALPAGLSMDPVTGVIAGTATAEQGPQGYTITATNGLGSTDVTIQIRVGLVFTLSGDSQTVSFDPANGLAAPFSVRANLRETPSGIGAPGFSEVAGWSFGMAFDDTIVTVINAVRGADAATANNGNPPAFETINLVTGGVTMGVVVDLFGVQTLLASTTQELLVVNCEAVPAFLQANPAGLTVEFPFSDNLGSPAVESVIVVGGGSVLPKFASATVDFTP